MKFGGLDRSVNMEKQGTRSSLSLGKEGELLVMARLLKEGYDIYPPLVDDKQVDCIIRNTLKGTPEYLDIQIKTRTNKCKKYTWAHFGGIRMIPRDKYFFIFYSGGLEDYWVVPSKKIAENFGKGEEYPGGYSINFMDYDSKARSHIENEKLKKYKNNFSLLKNFKL